MGKVEGRVKSSDLSTIPEKPNGAGTIGMSDIKNFAEALRSQIENVGETPETVDFHLTRQEFMDKMLKEGDGRTLLDLMEDGEWKVCERLGLTNAYYDGGTAYIDVPRWNNLLAHLRIVQSVFSKEEE